MLDPNKAVPTWDDADVFVAPLLTANPAPDEEFGDGWEQVGLLDGDEGFTQTREFDSSDRYAWGGRLFGSSRKNYKETHSFTAFENNEAMASILHPGSSIAWDGKNYTGTLKVPDLTHRFKIAFEKRYGAIVERRICSNYVQVEEFGDVTSNEEDGESYAVTVVVYPAADKALWVVSKTGAPLEAVSISVLPATSTKAAGSTTQLATTATYGDATTADVTTFAEYESSNEAKATVSATGLISFVATGSATITATYDEQTDTCAVTVS